MSGHRPFAQLKQRWSEERQAANASRKQVLKSELLSLEQLRADLGLSQEALAQALDVQQPAVSKLLRREDMRLSSLASLAAAMGGELQINVKFADRIVELDLGAPPGA